ncbi:MAG: hypothetical protein C4532_07160 [Candidatus Abyssobacteria bacterium SURF_17]|uniref:Uncharacterized protein n=1 Tax=Candidatus Abyssobacteria bacterium SURF_17 TaxID=2093361 RepID=A0A419F114_9BACT|nr:MAG: hypothetical protein C4532_07160 [Candidatus Abyssubacteria bacterium SURF_17]
MTTNEKRLKRNIARNQILDRELDYLPSAISRDEVRQIARMYGPRRPRVFATRALLGLFGVLSRYAAPFLGMVAGAEYRAAKALYPLMGKEQRLGDSLRFFLGESLSRKIDDANMAFKMTGALVAATPDIIFAALYGAVIGIAAYYALKWAFALLVSYRRRSRLNHCITELLR